MFGNRLKRLRAAVQCAAAPVWAPAASGAAADLHRTQIWIIAVLSTVVVMFACWATLVPLEGVVVAQGQIVVESNIKKVQHPTGGVVGEIRVREGQHVQAGETVIRLDDTQTKANLSVIRNEQVAARLRLARLTAERDEREAIAFPADLNALIESDAELVALTLGEQRLFQSRRTMREGQRAQLVSETLSARSVERPVS